MYNSPDRYMQIMILDSFLHVQKTLLLEANKLLNSNKIMKLFLSL